MNETDGFHQLNKQWEGLETVEFDPRYSTCLQRQAGLKPARAYSTYEL